MTPPDAAHPSAATDSAHAAHAAHAAHSAGPAHPAVAGHAVAAHAGAADPAGPAHAVAAADGAETAGGGALEGVTGGRPVSQVYWAEHAWLPGGAASSVRIDVADGRIAAVTPDVAAPVGAVRLAGLTLPGLANAHSHAFHRALRGRTQADRGTFWTWREQMYALAATLTPDSYYALARAVYAEMALAGITCVGEFHYLHHAPGGRPYADPNAMGAALIAAAADAGIRITLLDTCYLTGGIGRPLEGPQLRFGDGDAERWASRVTALAAQVHAGSDGGGRATRGDRAGFGGGGHALVGAALHSVRGVPPEQIGPIVRWAAASAAPLHTHLSEQPAENEACLAAYGVTPTRLLADAGALGPRTTVVHATHLTGEDIELIGSARAVTCACPTTERDLADGIGPIRTLFDAGSPLSLGSDSHAVIDLFEEARAVELDERLRTRERGHWGAAELLEATFAHSSLGWDDAGILAPGARADLVTLATDTVRTAGFAPGTAAETAVFAAGAADVRSVVVDGRVVVADGAHTTIDAGRALTDALRSAQ
ncbi:formimidoylglutamate deiminase [Cryptosporangium aurantiacum]|uniref:Formiminoglutamate deiminase n=1 Tax=Cryptosporangium aurantiacum TaxID=134849 RepID=A0A1M7PTK7_9ACTN|nr:formimidoylglutamate deiminase [Cryptosporangium aurantiacum]SHN20804.1 formiminoglutamate deiminase [Cryptosporangium aurantiacum]